MLTFVRFQVSKKIDMQPENVLEIVTREGERAVRIGSGNNQYEDPRWVRLRNRVMRRDKYTCKKCGSKIDLQVHHKEYIGGGVWSTPMGFLITLCRSCHKAVHKRN